MRIFNTTKNKIVVERVIIADSFLSRMIGLLNHKTLSPTEALMITRCQSIHMFFMRFPIDAIFVGKNNRVVGLVYNIKPFQLSPIFLKAIFVIEVAAGVILKSKTAIGDTLALEN